MPDDVASASLQLGVSPEVPGDSVSISARDVAANVWRRWVRFVPQGKLAFDGSPRDLVDKIAGLAVYRSGAFSPTTTLSPPSPSSAKPLRAADIASTAALLCQKWGKFFNSYLLLL